MYKKQTNRQLTIYDFDQPLGLTMNPENRWVKKQIRFPGQSLKISTLLCSAVTN
jgi:IS5 family transposase